MASEDREKLIRAVELLLLPGVTTTPIGDLMPFITDGDHRKYEIAEAVRKGMNNMTGEGLDDKQRKELISIAEVVRRH
ncbi:hypothetical protein ACIQKB_36870 [Streptomyces sp. NPDC092046]|uniref:hypothetical protein n=1 Tax=Streptomyces sp. NPDC092046 TaxID=3366009 RepID=UPI00381FF939